MNILISRVFLKKKQESEDEGTMPMEKMRTLLALLLKKISTPGRLKKLGFGTRLIDDVLKESISGKNKIFTADGLRIEQEVS